MNRDAEASQFIFNNWDTPVLFSGVEIGFKIKTGLPLIHNDAIKNSPVKDVFRISILLSLQDSAGRMSWDETAVLVAIKGYQPWYKIQQGKMIVAHDGNNTWSKESLSHSYLIEEQSPAVVEKLINTLIMHQPVKK